MSESILDQDTKSLD